MLDGGVRPQGLAAVLYHGIARGLSVITAKPVPEVTALKPNTETLPPVPLDSALLRLLTNMVLRVQSEVDHVY